MKTTELPQMNESKILNYALKLKITISRKIMSFDKSV